MKKSLSEKLIDAKKLFNGLPTADKENLLSAFGRPEAQRRETIADLKKWRENR